MNGERVSVPELVIGGAIGNVADEELLGVPPALPLVVAQLNLKEKPLQMLSTQFILQQLSEVRIIWSASYAIQEPSHLHFPAVEIVFPIEVANCLLRC